MSAILVARPVAGPVAGPVARPTSSGFLPPQLATLVSWHNAADTRTSSIVSSGGDVSDWLDQSGNGNHLTQGVGANQPTTGVEAQNGLNQLGFDGIAHYLQETATTNIADVILGDHTLFLVGEIAGFLSQNNCILSWNSSGGASNDELFCYASSDKVLLSFGITPLTTLTQSLSELPAILTMSVDHSGSLVTRLNGAEESDVSATGAVTSETFLFGAELDSGPSVGNFVDGSYGELIVYGRLLPSDEITQVEEYLADKWGITLP